MTATLKEKAGRYYAVINYKEGTKYKQKWVSIGLPVKNNKRKAEAKLAEILKEFEEQYQTPTDSVLFVDYIRYWLIKKKPLIELSTWEGYQIYAESHIIPYFQQYNLLICDVKPHHINEYYRVKYSSGRLDGKSGGLSIASLKKHGIVLKEALDDAVLDGLIDKNPARGVKMPGKCVTSTKRNFMTAEEANAMLKAFEGHRLQVMIYVTLYYGLRRSEALGLKWSAIDFKNNTITISHTVVKNKTIVQKDKTKTESSCHQYKLIEDVKNVLLKERERQQAYRREFGEQYYQSDYIFTWEDGRLFRPDYITRSFQSVLKKNNIKIMRFHDLRHSTASILYDKGWAIKDIQLWLRHSSIEVTADIYTHISEDRKAVIAESLNSMLSID